VAIGLLKTDLPTALQHSISTIRPLRCSVLLALNLLYNLRLGTYMKFARKNNLLQPLALCPRYCRALFLIVLTARPSMIYVPLLVNRFQKSTLLIVQYKHLNSCSGEFILQNLILRTISCGTGFITEPFSFPHNGRRPRIKPLHETKF